MLDPADPVRYRQGHIPGSWWAIRPRFNQVSTTVLSGGTAAWTAVGYPLDDGSGRPSTEFDDVWYKPYDHDRAVAHRRMWGHLDWEVALLQQIDRDELVWFRHFPT